MTRFSIQPENLGVMTDTQFGALKSSSQSENRQTVNVGKVDEEVFQKAKKTQFGQQFAKPTPVESQRQPLSRKIGNHETKVKYLGDGKYTGWKNEQEKYGYVRPKTNDMGKYQVIPGTLATYGDDIFGRDITKEEFLASPEMQDEFIDGVIARWRGEGFSDEDIIKMWHVGRNANLKNNPKADEYYRLVQGL